MYLRRTMGATANTHTLAAYHLTQLSHRPQGQARPAAEIRAGCGACASLCSEAVGNRPRAVASHGLLPTALLQSEPMTATLKDLVLAEARAAGFDAVRVTTPDAVEPRTGERLADFLQEGRHGDMEWMA